MARYAFNPAHLHYWIADGDGEFSRLFFRPVCDRSIRRHRDDFKNHACDVVGCDHAAHGSDTNCDTCTEIAALLAAARK